MKLEEKPAKHMTNPLVVDKLPTMVLAFGVANSVRGLNNPRANLDTIAFVSFATQITVGLLACCIYFFWSRKKVPSQKNTDRVARLKRLENGIRRLAVSVLLFFWLLGLVGATASYVWDYAFDQVSFGIITYLVLFFITSTIGGLFACILTWLTSRHCVNAPFASTITQDESSSITSSL